MSTNVEYIIRVSQLFPSPCPPSSCAENWHCEVSVDLEAQTVTGTRAAFAPPISPESLMVVTPTRTLHATTTTCDAIDEVFGVTRRSRHDSHPSLRSAGEVPPPPYADAELPVYSTDLDTEPTTFAMYLFKIGFVFPLFWILGTIILLFPLTAPPDFEPSKSERERQQLVAIIRDAELKWAKRCAWALVTLLVLVGFAAAIVLVVLR